MARSVAVNAQSKEKTTGGATSHRSGLLEKPVIALGTTALQAIISQGFLKFDAAQISYLPLPGSTSRA